MSIFKENTIKEVSYQLIEPANTMMTDIYNNLKTMREIKSVLDIPNYWKYNKWMVDVNKENYVSYSGGIVNIDLSIPFTFTEVILYGDGQEIGKLVNDRGLPTYSAESPQLKDTLWEIDFQYYEDIQDIVLEFKEAKIANSMIMKLYDNFIRNEPNNLLTYSRELDTWDYFATQIKLAVYLKDKLFTISNMQNYINILLGAPGFPITGTVVVYSPSTNFIYVRINNDGHYYDFNFPRRIMFDNMVLDLTTLVDQNFLGREIKEIGETVVSLISLREE